MLCACEIIEIENNSWVLSFSECIEGHMNFGPFNSSDEARYYCKNYFGDKYFNLVDVIDFEHPRNRSIVRNINSPPFKDRYWDFEDYKILAWRNAGFRSRK